MNFSSNSYHCLFCTIIILLSSISISVIANEDHEKPNILWLSVEDMGQHLGCYGYEKSITPNLDRLAAEGIRFTNTFSVAGVCAPTRSSIITGMYPTTIGSHNMRSGGEGKEKSSTPLLDDELKFFPEYLREAGYYCTNNFKQDYNFVTPDYVWDESSRTAHWKNRPDNKPFFAVFNYIRTHEGTICIDDSTHSKYTSRLTQDQRQEISSLKPPPYYPNTEITRKYWGRYLELITEMDYWVKEKLTELEIAGLEDNTIVMFWSDHGVGMPRAKRWIYDSGTRIPLIVYIPDKFRKRFDIASNGINRNIVSTIDFAPTVLELAGLDTPPYFQGKSFLSFSSQNIDYAYSVRDRMDERYEVIRSIRDKRFRYIINFTSYKPYYQIMETAEKSPIMKEIRRMNSLNSLNEAQSFYTKKSKPIAELYDLLNDPHEINNLIDDEDYSSIKKRLHEAVISKMISTKDLGLIPEAELLNLEAEFGSRYEIGNQKGYMDQLKSLIDLSLIARDPVNADEEYLLKMTKNEDVSVRYWGCVGLMNLQQNTGLINERLTILLDDPSSTVRIATADALFKKIKSEKAEKVLINELKNKNEWTRLAAIIVFDENPAIAGNYKTEIKQLLNDVENKYVVRVAKHILNRLTND